MLLDHLHGATTQKFPGGHDMVAEMEAAAEKKRAEGRKVYVIPGGGSNPTGALGYVNCAFELVAQANDRGLKIDRVVHATGSSGTQAGLVTGMCAMNAQVPVLGIGTRAPQPKQEQMVFDLAYPHRRKARLRRGGQARGRDGQHRLRRRRLRPADDKRHRGDPDVRRARRPSCSTPAIRAKGAAGLIDLARKGAFKDERIVFLHTGGDAALGGYDFAFDNADRWVTL